MPHVSIAGYAKTASSGVGHLDYGRTGRRTGRPIGRYAADQHAARPRAGEELSALSHACVGFISALPELPNLPASLLPR